MSQTDRDHEIVEILQARSADLLTQEEARNAVKRIRPDWYGDAA